MLGSAESPRDLFDETTPRREKITTNEGGEREDSLTGSSFASREAVGYLGMYRRRVCTPDATKKSNERRCGMKGPAVV